MNQRTPQTLEALMAQALRKVRTRLVGERDVLFAKAMIMHHEGAVEMAREYHANADARNGYLGLMNVDIVTDQTQEIALMVRNGMTPAAAIRSA